MTKNLFLGAATFALLTATVQAAAPQVITPSVVASVHDEPVDGLGDSFNASPFEGLIRTQSSRADRALQEYDVSALTGLPITSAMLFGRVSVNNSADNGVRMFDFSLYDGNGAADLTDYQIAATVVGTGQYHPPVDTTFVYQFDVTAQVQAMLTGGSTFIGLRVEGTSNPNFPNILVTSDCHLDIVAGPPPPVTFFCSGDGTGTPCPCGNTGTAGAGCMNSGSASGSSIGFTGFPSISGGTFQLTATGAVASVPSLFFEGTLQANGGAGAVLGDGLLCASGNITRLNVIFTDGAGSAVNVGDIPTITGVTATETRHYQFWFRDPTLGPCSTGSNLSNALTTTWLP